LPDGYREEKDGYSMYYYRDWKPLFEVLKESPEKLSALVTDVHLALEHLHNSSSVLVSKERVRQDLLYEMVEKLVERKKEVDPVLKPFDYIQSVNGVQLETFETLLQFFTASIDSFLESKPVFAYKPIHGDCQFNNVLVSPDCQKILFIDPRASFGTSTLYGLEEYDYAKVYFALSGYDTFDSSRIDRLIVEGSNITLPEIALNHPDLFSDPFLSILTASIWMGNAHCFKSKPLKAVTSYFYGLYYATLVFRNVKSLIK
jgi:streptomycin 6-kinase